MTRKEFIRRASKPKTIDVGLKLGGRVRIRSLSYVEADTVYAKLARNIAQAARFAITCALFDDKGKPMLTSESDPAIDALRFDVLIAIANRIYKLSGIAASATTPTPSPRKA